LAVPSFILGKGGGEKNGQENINGKFYVFHVNNSCWFVDHASLNLFIVLYECILNFLHFFIIKEIVESLIT